MYRTYDRRRFLAVAGAALGAALGAAACGGGGAPGGASRPTTTAPPPGDASAPPPVPGPAPGDEYWPPPDDGAWARVAPADAGWDPSGLEQAVAFAGERHSRSVVMLTGGRIVAERQWDAAPPDWSRDVASAQKSVVATLVGIAVDRGLLAPDRRVTDVLGPGWTLEPDAAAEARITVDHLCTMTSGLDGALRVAAPPGTTWYYDNDAYHRLHAVLETVAGDDLPGLTASWLWEPIGVRDARWVLRPERGFESTDAAGNRLWGLQMHAYDMARFGLLVERGGRWEGTTVVSEAWVRDMTTTSTALNPSYGRLWWLNGRDGHRLPGPRPPLQPGPLVPGAPADLVAALGANDQKIYVAPSTGTVVTRIGDSATGRPLAALSGFDEEWWSLLQSARRG